MNIGLTPQERAKLLNKGLMTSPPPDVATGKSTADYYRGYTAGYRAGMKKAREAYGGRIERCPVKV